MMLGKRARTAARPPMKRTTSMTEFTMDLNYPQQQQPSDPHHPHQNGGGPDQYHQGPKTLHRRNSLDSTAAAAAPDHYFLRVCSLCKRRLTPARDIYMYRGDSAFCSLECRQRKMGEDESKEKSCSPNVEAAAAAGKNKVCATGGGTVPAL